MKKFSTLRQARKKVGLSAQDTAFLFNLDISNISKYENGWVHPPLRILVCYYLLSKIEVDYLIEELKIVESQKILERAKTLKEKIENNSVNNKNRNRIEMLNNIIKNLEL